MSSRNRGTVSNKDDYYVTPHWLISEFLDAVNPASPHAKTPLDLGNDILDPSAGGCDKYEMSYPAVLNTHGYFNVESWDIRTDSRASNKGHDFLSCEGQEQYDTVITNPPFSISQEFLNNALTYVKPHGLVIMLQRLNWLGTQKRFEMWQSMPLHSVFVHHKRPGFNPECPWKTDSIEYAHFVFCKTAKENLTPNLFVI
ncbi:SAM-dependent methyltransferase [Pseudoalteromonas rhizosphaerae]|uniref:SAM-dependent methyltransferase n=1 Tax=Pseudoalteromonas rhizosphaerae TaxID=2518973 RepID=UPI00384F9EE4